MQTIINYNPQSDYEKADKEMMIEVYQAYGDKLFERFKLFHFTASGLVFNKSLTKVLMIHHKIYNSWSWMGGHMDGSRDFLKVATNEIKEESGLKNLTPIYKDPISIEVLPVWQHYKNGEVVIAHQHMNVSYAFIADEDEQLIRNKLETNGIKWVLISEFKDIVEEELMKPIYEKIIIRVQNGKANNI